ncbi:unnamed protein product [Adineta steineri]|uniref:Uncharacterized protein n=1 Tax=Adineta steineri TaxID=433720 RepID=A0A813YYY7_9BILA|nr:unnamed protein product [Adineta steineri]CAF1385195.1 unnamed protein product [Adineta steineri]
MNVINHTCLDHYDNNTERLVNALFDNTVPEHLKTETSYKSSIIPEFTTNINDDYDQSLFNQNLSLVGQRLNVYDNDEFDFYNRANVDLSKIHQGKKTRDTLSILDDKSHLEGMDERYSRLGIVADLTDGEYDDEYDDTYDDGIVNVRDKDDTIDNEVAKNENRLLGKQPGRFRQQHDDGDEEDDDNQNQNKRRQQFVENPEVVRERWAQQRAAWQQRYRPHQSHNQQQQQQQQQQQPQQHDVVGNARGRGQTTTVQHNRRYKDAHKSAQGNHHRRDRAAQKANRGLLS